MGRSKMTSLKIALLPLAICLLLSHKSEVSGKPSPKYFLIETKAKAKKIFDYTDNINNSGGVGVISDKSKNVNGNKQVFSDNKITGSPLMYHKTTLMISTIRASSIRPLTVALILANIKKRK